MSQALQLIATDPHAPWSKVLVVLNKLPQSDAHRGFFLDQRVWMSRFWSKNDEKIKVLRMSLPIVESLSGLQESIFSLFRGLQLNSRKKNTNWSNFIKFSPFPLLAHVGPMAVWGPLGCYYPMWATASCTPRWAKFCHIFFRQVLHRRTSPRAWLPRNCHQNGPIHQH